MGLFSAAPLSVSHTLFSPLEALLPSCQNLRDCPALSDALWLQLGVERVLHELPSGRGFLQQHATRFSGAPPRANYFESLKSSRRLALVSELNLRLYPSMAREIPDPLASYEDLANFDLYAGDGHWHRAAAHDAPIDGTRYATGHFYALSLRDHSLRHLAVGQGKKEHDMHVLKRLDAPRLRQGAPKGRQVLYAWDKACIDFRAWDRWKRSHGVYFVSCEKGNMKLAVTGQPVWDPTDPVNAGIQSMDWVSGLAGVLLRRIVYQEPLTGTIYTFLTNEMTIRPGLIALLYKLRWDIEKVFDELKNKFKEQQAWASTPEAKSAQAQLIALTHNLLVLLEEQLRREGIVNEAEIERRQQVLQAAQVVAHHAGRLIPSCVVALQRLTQRSVKLLRWLRSCLAERLPWHAATPRLRDLYAEL